MQERTARGVGSLAGEKISDLDHAIFVEKFGLKDLRGIKSDGVQGEEGDIHWKTEDSFAWWRSLLWV